MALSGSKTAAFCKAPPPAGLMPVTGREVRERGAPCFGPVLLWVSTVLEPSQQYS